MPRVLKPCGTVAAYQRHVNHGEKPCQSCRDAKRVYRGGRIKPVEWPRYVPPLDGQVIVAVEGLLLVPLGTILADRFGHAVQRIPSGGFWVLGQRWPYLAREVVDQGPFTVLSVPDGGVS
jgi:hypothetical protein